MGSRHKSATMFAFVIALVARKPLNVDIVHVGKMFLQMATLFAFVTAHVARKPYNVDIVDVGKMSFQISTMFAFVLAHVARKPCAASCCFAYLFL